MVLPTTWHDGIEILFFSLLFYYLALWLRKDRQQNLLWYFYGYCAITLTAYNANLPTVALFLLVFSPAIMMLFMFLHQDILQRNFVALRHITPAQVSTQNWLEALIQTCLIVINNNKTITCIIERSDNMRTFLQVPFTIHAPLHTALLEILVNGDSYDQHKMIWVDAHGNLEGINAAWRHTLLEEESKECSIQNNETTLLENALLYTTKTDALVFTINPETRTFSIIMCGNQLPKMSAHHAHATIQKHLSNLQNVQPKKGTFHAAHHKNHTDQKYTS